MSIGTGHFDMREITKIIEKIKYLMLTYKSKGAHKMAKTRSLEAVNIENSIKREDHIALIKNG